MSAHWYKDGVLVPEGTEGAYVSPTTVLDIIDKPALNQWQVKVGAEEALEVRLNSSEKGTRVHSACEDLANGIDTVCHEDDLPYILGFVNWFQKYQPEVLETEMFVVSHEHRFAGTVDLVCMLNKALWIIDLKTGQSNPAHGLQLAAYQRAYFEMTGLEARVGVLRLTNKTKQGYGKVKEYDEELWHFLAHKLVFEWWLSKRPVKKEQDLAVFGVR